MLDPRWDALARKGFHCRCCGRRHNEVFDLGSDMPDVWTGPSEPAANRLVNTSDTILTEDFCKIDGEWFFIRCVLELPLLGSDGERFGFGPWASVRKADFERYASTFDSGEQSDIGEFPGRLVTDLRPYAGSFNARCRVLPRDGRQRPNLRIIEEGHPLAVDQDRGVDFDGLMRIYDAYGHGPGSHGEGPA